MRLNVFFFSHSFGLRSFVGLIYMRRSDTIASTYVCVWVHDVNVIESVRVVFFLVFFCEAKMWDTNKCDRTAVIEWEAQRPFANKMKKEKICYTLEYFVCLTSELNIIRRSALLIIRSCVSYDHFLVELWIRMDRMRSFGARIHAFMNSVIEFLFQLKSIKIHSRKRKKQSNDIRIRTWYWYKFNWYSINQRWHHDHRSIQSQFARSKSISE